MLRITLLILIVLPSVILVVCPKDRCVDPCFYVVSPYCERKSCDICYPICFDRKGGKELPCDENTYCTEHCPYRCGRVIDKNCKPSCSGCKAICYGDDGKQIHCTLKRPCPTGPCPNDPCSTVTSPYCVNERICFSCYASCSDRKGGKYISCDYKNEERRASK